MNKRDFLRASAGTGLGLLLGENVWARFAHLPAERLAEDEAFWSAIRAKYRLKPDYINLESAYYSIQATPVLESFIAKVREVNYQGSYYLRTTQAEAFKKFEAELLAGKLDSQAKQLEAFKRHISADLRTWDKDYLKQLGEWCKQSPENMR